MITEDGVWFVFTAYLAVLFALGGMVIIYKIQEGVRMFNRKVET